MIKSDRMPNPYSAYMKGEAQIGRLAGIARERKYRYLAKRMLTFLGGPGPALEVGAGMGYFTRQWNGPAVCLDFQYESCRITNDLGRFSVRGDFTRLPFREKVFDCVVASYVLEHTRNSAAALQLVNECARILKPNGYAAFLVPDMLQEGTQFWNRDFTHEFVTTHRRVEQVLVACGFSLISSHSIFLCFHGFLRFLILVPFKPLHATLTLLWKLFPFPGLPPTSRPDHSLLLLVKKYGGEGGIRTRGSGVFSQPLD